ADRPVEPLVPPNKVTRIVEARPLVAQVTALEVTPTFVVVLVTAQARTGAGAYGAQLVQVPGTGTFDFRAFAGGGPGDGALTASTFVSAGDLGAARTITVRGRAGAVSRSR
ncbi:MAG: hypothetical protein ACU0CO_09430, partial [Shimia sp.]